MSFRPKRLMIAAATVALLAFPTVAAASPSQLIGMADENIFNPPPGSAIAATPGGAATILAQWKAAGVQDVRTFAQWNKLAPDIDSTKVPAGFKAKDPASYDFSTLDNKLNLILAAGMTPTLVITGPGPVWGSSEPARRDGLYAPSPAMFGDFAIAVAKHVAARVQRYIVWNEPNVGSWLQPQYKCTSKGSCQSYAPHLYRQLARAGYQAIHGADSNATVAVGGTSSLGNKFPVSQNTTTQPLTFLRQMACVNDKYQAVRTGLCKNFKPVTGDVLSYHPYSQFLSPGKQDPDKNNARMPDLPRLIQTVDKLTAKHRIKVNGAKKFSFWFDEYGYETNPPDKRNKDLPSPTTAASWSQWGWSIAARNPRVKMLTQYEWYDEQIQDLGANFNGWQGGLFSFDGKAKPLAKVFSQPIFGWRTAKKAFVWGQARPGNTTTKITLQRKGGSGYATYKTLTSDKYGVFQVNVPLSTSARYRFSYTDPVTSKVVTSAVTPLVKTS